jgi:hypothetical protein
VFSFEHISPPAGKWHVGQRTEYLPNRRGFDAFYGLPFSVDDGTGYASPCSPSSSHLSPRPQSHAGLLPTARSWDPVSAAPSDHPIADTLGPQTPLPLIRQIANESLILNQPTDLVPLTADYARFAKNFSTVHKDEPMLLYIAFSHVHTATRNIPNGRQYAGCGFVNSTKRGPFGDALAEVVCSLWYMRIVWHVWCVVCSLQCAVCSVQSTTLSYSPCVALYCITRARYALHYTQGGLACWRVSKAPILAGLDQQHAPPLHLR